MFSEDTSMLYLVFGSVILLIVFIIAFATIVNKRSACKSGTYSRDGKGSFIDPCVSCPPDNATVDLIKGLPNGSYQCSLGSNFENLVATGIGSLIGMADDIIPSGGSSQCEREFLAYNGAIKNQNINNVLGDLQANLPSCNIAVRSVDEFYDPSGGYQSGRLTLFTDTDGLIREVRLEQ